MDDTHPFFVRRMSRRQLVMLDVVAGVCSAFVLLTAMVHATMLPPWMRIAVSLGLGLPLALRRVWPLPVFCFTLMLALYAALVGMVGLAYLAPAYALYIVASSGKRGPAIPTSTIGAVSLISIVGLVTTGASHDEAPGWLFRLDQPLLGIAALGGAWTVGRAVQERRSYAARDSERRAAQAVAEERLRIARELHDVVTHGIGLIAVKAGVANHVMATRPEEAHDALRVIETASRSALVEMRHLLGVLRSTEVPDRAPTPGLAGIRGLVSQARLAGVEVELDLRTEPNSGQRQGGAEEWGRLSDGEQRQEKAEKGERLPDGVGLSAYRIVQEALTNVVKHAAPARCRVTVVADGREVRIEVIDDGPGRRTMPSDGAGHGLIGMRERVMVYGGTLQAGSLPGRGFRVSATLPYEEAL